MKILMLENGFIYAKYIYVLMENTKKIKLKLLLGIQKMLFLLIKRNFFHRLCLM